MGYKSGTGGCATNTVDAHDASKLLGVQPIQRTLVSDWSEDKTVALFEIRTDLAIAHV